jgi:hypothetical protein
VKLLSAGKVPASVNGLEDQLAVTPSAQYSVTLRLELKQGRPGLSAEVAAMVTHHTQNSDVDIIDVGGVGGTLAGNAMSVSAMRATLEHVLTAGEIIDYQQLVRRVPVPDHIYRFAAQLVRKTRPRGTTAPAWLKPLVSWGAGPRAVQYLVLGAKSRAALTGSYMVRLEDVQAVAAPVLTHRLITTFAAQAEGIDGRQIVARLVEETIDEQKG